MQIAGKPVPSQCHFRQQVQTCLRPGFPARTTRAAVREGSRCSHCHLAACAVFRAFTFSHHRALPRLSLGHLESILSFGKPETAQAEPGLWPIQHSAVDSVWQQLSRGFGKDPSHYLPPENLFNWPWKRLKLEPFACKTQVLQPLAFCWVGVLQFLLCNNLPVIGNYIQRQVQTWSKQYRATETHTIAAMERLIEWLPSHLPASERLSVVHGDFRYPLADRFGEHLKRGRQCV